MPVLQGIARSVALALVLALVLITAWVCLIAGAVWALAGTTGTGAALLWVGGGLLGLVVLPLAVAALAGRPSRGGRSGLVPAGLVRGAVTLAAAPGGLRLLLALASALFALLAILALLLASRRVGSATGAATADRLSVR